MGHFTKVFFAMALTITTSACAERPGEQVSLRATIADWIAPPGYQPDGGPVPLIDPMVQQQTQIIRNGYQADIARQQAGAQSMNVSQVTIIGNGGQVSTNVGSAFSGKTDWRPAEGVTSVTVAECESTAINIARGDKQGGASIYLTRINSIIFVTPFGTSGCQVPYGAQSFPGYGRFPLHVQGKVSGATIQIAPWGSAPTMNIYGQNPYDNPYGFQQRR